MVKPVEKAHVGFPSFPHINCAPKHHTDSQVVLGF